MLCVIPRAPFLAEAFTKKTVARPLLSWLVAASRSLAIQMTKHGAKFHSLRGSHMACSRFRTRLGSKSSFASISSPSPEPLSGEVDTSFSCSMTAASSALPRSCGWNCRRSPTVSCFHEWRAAFSDSRVQRGAPSDAFALRKLNLHVAPSIPGLRKISQRRQLWLAVGCTAG